MVWNPVCLEGNGNCTEYGTCLYGAGWTGPSCAIAICFNKSDHNRSSCSGHGSCIEPNRCLCDEGHTGMECEAPVFCPMVANCSGNGVCASETECVCYKGFSGIKCDRSDSHNNCNRCFGRNEKELVNGPPEY